MLPGALLCVGHTHRAEPPSVPEAQYWRPPSLPPFSHPENGKRRQALPFPPSGSGFTLPLCRVRGPAQADRASGLTTSVPCLKLSVAPHQLLHKVRIPRWCPTALGDRPLPASRGPVCLPGLPTPASRGPARPPGLPRPASWGPVRPPARLAPAHSRRPARPPGLPLPSGHWVSLPSCYPAGVSALPPAVPSPDRPFPSRSRAGPCLPPSPGHFCSVHSVPLLGQSESLWARTSWSPWDFLLC